MKQRKSSTSASGSKASRSASGRKASRSASGSKASRKRSDIPQLGEHAKESISPLKVLSEDVPELLLQQQYDEAAKLAAVMGVTIAELLGSQDNLLPILDVAPKYVPGMPLVSEERYQQLPTHMRNLYDWYMEAVKTGRKMIVAKVSLEYYFREEKIHVEFEELF